MDDLGLFASVLGHIGDGNFHESIMYDKTKPGERERVEHVVYNMVDLALEMEGTCTVSVATQAPICSLYVTRVIGRAWNWPWQEKQFGQRTWC